MGVSQLSTSAPIVHEPLILDEPGGPVRAAREVRRLDGAMPIRHRVGRVRDEAVGGLIARRRGLVERQRVGPPRSRAAAPSSPASAATRPIAATCSCRPRRSAPPGGRAGPCPSGTTRTRAPAPGRGSRLRSALPNGIAPSVLARAAATSRRDSRARRRGSSSAACRVPRARRRCGSARRSPPGPTSPRRSASGPSRSAGAAPASAVSRTRRSRGARRSRSTSGFVPCRYFALTFDSGPRARYQSNVS